MTSDHRPLLAAHARYRWDTQRAEHQLLFPEGILILNEPGAAIIRLCDGRSLADLLAALRNEFPHADLTEDVSIWHSLRSALPLLDRSIEHG